MERHNRITPTYTAVPSRTPKPLSSPSKPSGYLPLPPKPCPFPAASAPYIGHQPEMTRRISRRVDDAELSIFDAKKYFNDSSVTEEYKMPTNQCAPSVSSIDSYGKNYRNGSIPTSVASSEASCNSQSGLLSRLPHSVKVKPTSYSLKEKPKPPPSPGRCCLFSLRCPCVGKKSLETDEKLSEPNSPFYTKPTTNKLHGNQIEDDSASSIVPLEKLTKVRISTSTWSKERDFIHPPTLFPAKAAPPFHTEVARTIAKPIVFSLPDIMNNNKTKTTTIEPPRESIEVFGTRRTIAPPTRIVLKADEEQLSDTSSDLFELDSCTANSFGTTSYSQRRDSLDDLLDPRWLLQLPPGMKRNFDETEQSECCYPPSEVSVQWSVTTAEGFDRASVANFSSAASEFDETRFIHAGGAARIEKRKAAAGAGGGIGGGLLSCRGDKAVQVRCNSGRANRTVK
jgi:hypothetical protein